MLKLHEQSGVPYSSEAAVSDLRAAMKSAGIDRSVLLHIATKESQHKHVLEFAKETDKDPFISSAPSSQAPKPRSKYIWRISDEGLRGVKFTPRSSAPTRTSKARCRCTTSSAR